MSSPTVFRSARLSGHAPGADDPELYAALFGDDGIRTLKQNRLLWSRHHVAPWTLAHAGQRVGVGGFRIGFGDKGLELSFHFLPTVWGQGLASEFVQAAMDHAQLVLREERFFAHVESDNPASRRILEKAGFAAAPGSMGGSTTLMRLRLASPAMASQ